MVSADHLLYHSHLLTGSQPFDFIAVVKRVLDTTTSVFDTMRQPDAGTRGKKYRPRPAQEEPVNRDIRNGRGHEQVSHLGHCEATID